jgi:SAM-dependent methyltransferase
VGEPSASPVAYDVLGQRYASVRRADPRLERAIWQALGSAQTVLNVGAGAGSYEPRDRWVLAAEPSEVMIAQRSPDAAPVIRAVAEDLPLADEMVDAVMAVLTLQHWHDVDAGIRELVRVARRRIVLVTMDVDRLAQLWIVRDYFPELLGDHARKFPTMEWLGARLPAMRIQVLPVPRDCQDQFMAALWSRPEAYLDPRLRAGTSPWYDLPVELVEERLGRLRADLVSGRWRSRNGDLLELTELDVGLRLITASKPVTDPNALSRRSYPTAQS